MQALVGVSNWQQVDDIVTPDNTSILRSTGAVTRRNNHHHSLRTDAQKLGGAGQCRVSAPGHTAGNGDVSIDQKRSGE
jgi:hypothetical protein